MWKMLLNVSLVVVFIQVFSGCTNQLKNIDALNMGLNGCTNCPFKISGLKNEGSLNLSNGHELVIETVRLAIPKKAGIPLFTKEPVTENELREVSPPSISRYNFVIPTQDSDVTRSEALFVAFLMSAGQDYDYKVQNIGRDYSERIKRADGNSEKVRDVIRGYTKSMEIMFSFDDTKKTIFEKFQNGLCESSGKSEKITTQILKYDARESKNDKNIEIDIGIGADWLYTKTLEGITANSIHTSVINTTNRANSLYSFDVNYTLIDMETRKPIKVNVCESYADLANRLGRKINMVERSCEFAPPKDNVYKHKSPTPCYSGQDNKLDKTKSFQIVIGEGGGFSRNIIMVGSEYLKEILPAPGDYIIFK